MGTLLKTCCYAHFQAQYPARLIFQSALTRGDVFLDRARLGKSYAQLMFSSEGVWSYAAPPSHD